MTNEERRRRSGEAAAASRGTGEAAAAARRAIEKANIEARTGRTAVEDIRSLARPERPRRSLRPVAPVGAVPATRGRADYKAPPQGSGGGIASPLIEQPDTREYYDPVLLPSTDGLAWVLWRSVKVVTMTDANGATVEMEYQNVTP